MEQGIEVFLSYAHSDKALRDELLQQLASLKRQKLISIWHDGEISAGTDWQRAIDRHLNTAPLILLLISPDFFASEDRYSREMQRAVERHDAGEARVIPIILRPTDWHDTPFAKLQALPPDGRPVTSWSSRDTAFLAIAQGIRTAVEELRTEARLGQLENTLRDQGTQIIDQKEQIINLQDTINDLVRYSMSASVFRHLVGIACMYEYQYINGESSKREMYFLRDNGFIRPKSKLVFLDFNASLDGRNLVEIAEPTEIGWSSVKLRKEEALLMLREGEKYAGVDLVDIPNVRVDPATAVPLKR